MTHHDELNVYPGEPTGYCFPGEPAVIERADGVAFTSLPEQVVLVCTVASEHRESFIGPAGLPMQLQDGKLIVAYPTTSPCGIASSGTTKRSRLPGGTPSPHPGDEYWRYRVEVNSPGSGTAASSPVYVTNGTGDDGWPPMRP